MGCICPRPPSALLDSPAYLLCRQVALECDNLLQVYVCNASGAMQLASNGLFGSGGVGGGGGGRRHQGSGRGSERVDDVFCNGPCRYPTAVCDMGNAGEECRANKLDGLPSARVGLHHGSRGGWACIALPRRCSC